MPKTKFQNTIFTIMMVLVMVYVMICYNIAISKEGMTNEIFRLALHELIIMVPFAFLMEFFIIEKVAVFLAFRIVTPDDRPLFIQLAISSMIVCFMCPVMSLAATILFKHPGNQVISIWLQTTALNFPMAFFWQIFFAGPFVRFLFRTIFRRQLAA